MVKVSVLLIFFSLLISFQVKAENNPSKTEFTETLRKKAFNSKQTNKSVVKSRNYEINVPLFFIVNQETNKLVNVFTIKSNKFYLPTNPTFEIR